MPYRVFLLLLSVVFLPPSLVLAQPVEEIRARYTKYEYRIPMRDGKKLFTSVYAPKDDSQTYPILIMRTPYSCKPYGVDQYRADIGPSPLLVKEGYIFVCQDVRGRWMSEGEFVNMRPQRSTKGGSAEIDESTDTYDTVDWLIKHVPNNNGKAGLWGISYPGFYAAAGAIDAHPALKAVSPQAPINDWFIGDDFHHNGALFLPHLFNFIVDFGRPRPEPTKKSLPRFEHDTNDGYDFFMKLGPLANADTRYLKKDIAFWDEVMNHPDYDDFWKAHNLRPHLKNIKPAVLTVGGWFDAENLFGALQTFKSIDKNNPESRNILVMGPWRHGGWHRSEGESLGDINFNSKTSIYFREQIEFPFFEYYLKGKGEMKYPKAWTFETGTNQWRRHDSWPPKSAEATTLYFQPHGKLGFQPPPRSKPEFDEYVSDPAKPVPFVDKISIGMAAEYMTGDQRFAGRRPDVLVYQTDPLEDDVTLAGPIEAELHVSTSGTDSDWIIKLIDVYPDDYPDPKPDSQIHMSGYQQLIRGDVMRGKYRKSFEKPEAFVPDQPDKVKFTLNDCCHTFRSGHRIMIQVQSSWFPLVDRNPQKFVDIYKAKEEDFQKATQRVYHSADMASRIIVWRLPASEAK
jgi:putative CocE/NonD family hydrolase